MPIDFKASKRLRTKQILCKHIYFVFGLNLSLFAWHCLYVRRALFFPLIRKRKIWMNSYKQKILGTFSTPFFIAGEIGGFHLT